MDTVSIPLPFTLLVVLQKDLRINPPKTDSFHPSTLAESHPIQVSSAGTGAVAGGWVELCGPARALLGCARFC